MNSGNLRGRQQFVDLKFPKSIPEAPKNISQLIKQSAYFGGRKDKIKPFYPSSRKPFDTIDDELPEGFKIQVNKRQDGKHADKEFLTPDRRYVMRSKLSVFEYCKLVVASLYDIKNDPDENAESEGMEIQNIQKDEIDIIKMKRKNMNHKIQNTQLADDKRSSIVCEKQKKIESAEVIIENKMDIEENDGISVLSHLPQGSKIKLTFIPESVSTSNVRKKQKNFSCSICQKIFKTGAGFDAHVFKNHKNARPYDKDTGKLVFPEKRHSPEKVQNTKYFCHSCTKSFAHKSNLAEHMRTMHTVTEPIIKFENVFDTQLTLEAHAQSENGFKCESCEDTCLTKEEYYSHMNSHTNCQVCEDDFSWAESDHWCYYTRNRITPSHRVVVQNLYGFDLKLYFI